MTAYIVERFFDLGLHLIIRAYFIGSFSPLALLGLVIVGGFSVLFTKKFDLFLKFKIVRKLEDFKDSLNNLMSFRVGFVIFITTIFSFIFQSLAIQSLVNTSFILAMTVVALGGIVVSASPTPIGLGIYEVSIPGFLVSQGVSPEVALGGILTFRFLTVWLPALLGLWVVNRRF
jgi:uncharacterized membrane protein YbhN (UPF0104 family)